MTIPASRERIAQIREWYAAEACVPERVPALLATAEWGWDEHDRAERVRWRMGTSMFVGYPMTEPLPDDAPGIEDMWAKVDAGIGLLRLGAAAEHDRAERLAAEVAERDTRLAETIAYHDARVNRADEATDAARANLAALIAELGALCDGVMPSSPYTLAAEFRAVIARHAEAES